MIFITGDTHGNFRRFNVDNFPEQKSMTKADYVIICGDFGGVWGDSRGENYWLNWLNDKPFTTLFVSGNHENYDLLGKFPVQNWNGGEVQYVRESIFHLMRGQVYTINERRFFTMGGAQSHDIQGGILEPDDPNFKNKQRELIKKRLNFRVNRKSWWTAEMPNNVEYETARHNLETNDWKVNYIISHCCPTSVQAIIGDGLFTADRLTNFFDELASKCEFNYWFFGHYHDNRVIMGKYELLYEQIISII